jgi:hypothetical protein
MGIFLSKLKKILRRQKEPAYSLSAEWVIQQLKLPREIIPIYDDEKITVEQVRQIENFRTKKVGAQSVYIQCTHLITKVSRDELIDKAISICCEEACFRTTGIRVNFMVRLY